MLQKENKTHTFFFFLCNKLQKTYFRMLHALHNILSLKTFFSIRESLWWILKQTRSMLLNSHMIRAKSAVTTFIFADLFDLRKLVSISHTFIGKILNFWLFVRIICIPLVPRNLIGEVLLLCNYNRLKIIQMWKYFIIIWCQLGFLQIKIYFRRLVAFGQLL